MSRKTTRVIDPSETVQITARVTVHGKELIKDFANEKRLSVSQLIIFLLERELKTKEHLGIKFN